MPSIVVTVEQVVEFVPGAWRFYGSLRASTLLLRFYISCLSMIFSMYTFGGGFSKMIN